MQSLAVSRCRRAAVGARPALAAVVGVVGLALGLGSFKKSLSLGAKQKQYERRRTSQEVVELKGNGTLVYPWTDQSLENWEFKKVRALGYYTSNRFVVSRERNGVPGYLIFANFVTHAFPYSQDNCYENGILVNMGWIPKEDRTKISTELEGSQPAQITPEMKTQYMQVFDEEHDFYKPLHLITGYLRRGQTAKLGRTNFVKAHNYNLIDTNFIANRLFVGNLEARNAYIELIGEQGESLLKPANAVSFEPPQNTSSGELRNAVLQGVAGLAAAAGVLFSPI